jgi:Rad3-related DNA helicase
MQANSLRERRFIMNKTEDNLNEASAGEFQANRKYFAFVKNADKDGSPLAAKLFKVILFIVIVLFVVIVAFITAGCGIVEIAKKGGVPIRVSHYAIEYYAASVPDSLPRYTDNEDGTVTDNATGLIWLKDASQFSRMVWKKAIKACESLEDDGTKLTDGSRAGDWRLPTLKELQSLLDYRQNLRFWISHLQSEEIPFENVKNYYYWTGTDDEYYDFSPWLVRMPTGTLKYFHKTRGGKFRGPDLWYNDRYYTWPVRGIANYE